MGRAEEAAAYGFPEKRVMAQRGVTVLGMEQTSGPLVEQEALVGADV